MEHSNHTPEQLLKVIQEEEKNKELGQLKIFFGYAAGVGKTYAMLEAAHLAKERGMDVVIGYIEPHTRPKTMALLRGLEQLPNLQIAYNGIRLREFDLDAALQRKPEIVIVDELAHTNAAGCRHEKRYQDTEELLNAGIDVYTTINVQHIESLNDTVSSITGVRVRERIPDFVFDRADQVELVDIEPQDLIDRFQEGDVYKEHQARQALQNFFSIKNLTALREIAMRRCADKVNRLTESANITNISDYHTDEHILVCLSPSPSNAKVIRTAARMANAFKGIFTALYVETPEFADMSDQNQKRFRANMHLAEQLGATIETVYGEDIPFQIAEFARLSGVSQIVIGRSAAIKKKFLGQKTLVEKLISDVPNMDVHIIPDIISADSFYRLLKIRMKVDLHFSPLDLLKSVVILLASSLIGFVFQRFGFVEANIIIVYVLGVLLISVVTKNRVYSLISSVVSVLLFNFLFTDPKYTFQATGQGYPVTFIIMFLAAFITSSLALQLQRNTLQSAKAAYRIKVLFDTNQLLQKASDKEEIVSTAASQLNKLLGKDIIIYLADNNMLGAPMFFSLQEKPVTPELISNNEKAVASWVLKNNKHAGTTTRTFSNALARYLAVRVNDRVYGVVGIVMGEEPLDTFENSILLSLLGEFALSLENEHNAREKEAAKILAKNEQLRANILRTISHDLRTPLTSISGNASNLISNSEGFDDETKKQLYKDIYDDSMWLINLVENLLTVTRIEEGRMNLRITEDLVEDAVAEALQFINRKSEGHSIRVEHKEDYLLAKMDIRLIVQVIINILDNAIKYTPKDSHIVIKTEKHGDKAVISIADDGEGLSDESKKRVFDRFYNGSNTLADSRRSLGLGLSLCQSIVNAHGGEIFVRDNQPHGTVFTFTLPTGEVQIHE